MLYDNFCSRFKKPINASSNALTSNLNILTVITDKSGPKMYKLFSAPIYEKIASILLNLES